MSKLLTKTIGAAIKKLREHKGIDQATLALAASASGLDSAPLSQAVLSQIESGRIAQPNRDRLRAIAAGLGVSYNTLLLEAGWIDPPPPGGHSDALHALAEGNPGLTAKLELLRDETTPDTYERAMVIVARFLGLGIDTARDLVAAEGKVAK